LYQARAWRRRCTIRGCIADPAFAVAYAGDEFVIVVAEQDRSGAIAVATEIRSRLAARQFLATAGFAIRRTARFGVAVYPARRRRNGSTAGDRRPCPLHGKGEGETSSAWPARVQARRQ